MSLESYFGVYIILSKVIIMIVCKKKVYYIYLLGLNNFVFNNEKFVVFDLYI